MKFTNLNKMNIFLSDDKMTQKCFIQILKFYNRKRNSAQPEIQKKKNK